jgi:HSP20 family protein
MKETNALAQQKQSYDPLSPFGWTFGRWFDDVLSRRGEDGQRLVAPPIDITEDEHAVVVSVELPGMKKEDVRLQVENGVLTISGEKRTEESSKERGWHVMERRYGAFHRQVVLPRGVAAEKAEASFENGILTVSLPKREDVKPKTLSIK